MMALGAGGYVIRTRRGPPPTPVVPLARVRPIVAEIRVAPADILPQPQVLREPVARLLQLVSEISGVSRADLCGDRRVAAIARPRQVVFFLARRFTRRSLPEIGRRIGGRDHTTALHSIRRVEALIARIGAPAEETPEAWARHLLAGVLDDLKKNVSGTF